MENQNELSFSNIWFLKAENTLKNFKFLAMDDVGNLICTKWEIIFRGKKNTFTIKNIKSLCYRKQGRDFINNWIKITFDENETSQYVYVADGRFLGWAGVFGGTKKMYITLSKMLSVY